MIPGLISYDGRFLTDATGRLVGAIGKDGREYLLDAKVNNDRAAVSGRDSLLNELPPAIGFPTVMAVPPTVTSGALPTLARRIYAATDSATFRVASSPKGAHFTISRTNPTGNGGIAVSAASTVTPGVAGQTAIGNMQVSFTHVGQNIEIGIYNATGFLIRVDGQYVSFTSTVVASTVTYYKLAFASVAARRIDVIGYLMSFMGVAVDAGDSVMPVPVRGPRVLCLGDSFTQPSDTGWPSWFSDCMGWDDVWAAGVGGTGYVATNGGASKKFRDRIAADVIPYAPDIVLMLGSLNDNSSAALTIGSEAAASVAQIKAALPDCLVIGGMNGVGGVETMQYNALDNMDAVRSAFLSAGGVWLNPAEMPLEWSGATPQTVLVASHAAGRVGATPDATPFNVATATTGIRVTNSTAANDSLPVGHTVEIGTGATRERKVINGRTQITGTDCSYSFQGTMRYAHSTGETVRVVGPSYLTGSGKVGATTSWGNSDTLVSSDGVHPSAEGHRMLAYVQAQLLRNYLAGVV